MNQLAIVFSGQGSQYVQMGLDYINHDQAYKNMAEQASKVLGFNCIDVLSSEKVVTKTLYTQPLMILKSIFGYEEIKKLNPEISAIAGFSLGEYTAYYAASVYDFQSILKLVSKRAYYMDQASKNNDGAMAAIIGLNKDQVEEVCLSLAHQGIIKIANENEYKQFVISGEKKLVDKAIQILKEKGARRAVLLQTSGAFHTPLMQEASKKFIEEITKDDILKPKQHLCKMYMNYDSLPLLDKDVIMHMEKQMTHPVLFIDTIVNMKKDGMTHILEIGPGKVLTNLIKKIDPSIETMHFDKFESLEDVKGWLKIHGFTK